MTLALEMIKERTSKNVLNSNHLITSVSRTIIDKIESRYLYIKFSKNHPRMLELSTLSLFRDVISSFPLPKYEKSRHLTERRHPSENYLNDLALLWDNSVKNIGSAST